MSGCWQNVTAEQADQLAAYRDLILESNRQFNLTALRDAEAIEGRLIAESLRLAPFLPNQNDLRIIDVGTGSGIPGIPLAIARPDSAFTLVDATGKRVRFLELVISELDLRNVTAIHERSEALAHDPAHREVYDIALARAVTQLAALAELILPFLRTGGRALLPKGEELSEELARAESAIEILGGTLQCADLLPQVSCCGVTRLVILDKIGPSLVRYPRRPGIPEHDPLGGNPCENGSITGKKNFAARVGNTRSMVAGSLFRARLESDIYSTISSRSTGQKRSMFGPSPGSSECSEPGPTSGFSPTAGIRCCDSAPATTERSGITSIFHCR